MTDPTHRPNDPLRDAWQAARQLDDDPAPSPGVRARILAQARGGIRGSDVRGPDIRASDVRAHDRSRARPANDSRWRIAAIASVMTMSLAGWLAWQLRHGVPAEPTRFETASTPTAPALEATPSAPAAPATAVGRDARREEAREAARGRAYVEDRVEERESGRRAPASKAAAASAPPGPTAAASPARTLVAAAAGGDLDGIRRALADGAEIDAADAHGNTPLVAAVRARRAAAVRLLLEAGADPNRADRDGVAPLQHAQGDVVVTDLLIAAGAR